MGLNQKFIINPTIHDNTSLCVISYNSRGFCRYKQEFLRLLCSSQIVGTSIHILCVQENFILRANSYKIINALPDFFSVIKPAVKNSFDSGRPKNGMVIAVPRYINGTFEDVSPNYWRLQAIIIRCSSYKLLIINSYFPVDPKTINFNDEELLETLNHIRHVLNTNQFNQVLWAGDINADFFRNTGHVNTIKQFVDEYNFQCSWELFSTDFTNIHEINGISHTSTIDHFFWSPGLTGNVLDAGVIHHPSNLSDHSPIYCKVNIAEIDSESITAKIKSAPKPSWKNSSCDEKAEYIDHLRNLLDGVNVPKNVTECENVHCKDADHIAQTDHLVAELLECVDKAADQNLHKANPNRRKSAKKPSIPGWNDLVKPYKDDSFFWHQVWVSAGRPINNVLHSVMKRTRNLYHFHLKKCKKAENSIRRNKLLDACLNGNGNIFAEIKKMRMSEPVVASTMDGKKEKIEEHFKNVYENLYNSVDDEDNISDIMNDVNDGINDSHLFDVKKVTPGVVKATTMQLQDCKSDPVHIFNSDCLKNAPDLFFQHLSSVIKSFLVHGHVTVYLLLATLVPIVKNKLSSISTSKNYRSIAISSLILKTIDWIILSLFGKKLGLDELQFAYQGASSTTMCTWSVIETIGYFLRNGSEIFSCQTDMTKAFDLVQHSLLFLKLLQEGLSRIFVRLMIFIYKFQFANVRWNGIVSSIFSLCNGVRQGAVLSGILYCFYVNNLFKLLRRKSTGCWINNNFHGMFGYSDDNWVIAPTFDALKEMMETIEEYCRGHNLKFSTDPNPSKCKTKCIAYLKKQRDLPSIMLNGNPLPWVKEGMHLGNNIECSYNGMVRDIRVKRASFIQKNCELQQEFMFAHPKTRFKTT